MAEARRARRAWPLLAALVLGGCGFERYAAQPLAPQHFVEAFAQRRLDAPALAEFMTTCGLPRSPWPRPQWDAAALGCAAMFFDPGVARARAGVEVVRAGERTAAQRPGIGVGGELEHHSDQPDGQTPWSVGADLQLRIEPPGRRAARIEGALARRGAAEIELDTRARTLRRQAAAGLLAYAQARRQAALAEARAALLGEVRDMLGRRRAEGYASPFELATVERELHQAELAAGTATAAVTAARDALAAGIGLPAAALEGVTLDVAPYADVPAAAAGDAAALQARALTERGDIRLALQRYAVTEAALKEAVAAQYPDFTLAPGYLFDQADRVWRFAASLALPGGRNAGPIAEARARREEAARAVEEVQAAIVGEVHAAVEGDRAARRAAQQAARLLAAAQAEEAVVQRRVAHGEDDRLALVHARLTTLDARQRRDELIGAAWRARQRLEAAVSGAPGELDPRISS